MFHILTHSTYSHSEKSTKTIQTDNNLITIIKPSTNSQHIEENMIPAKAHSLQNVCLHVYSHKGDETNFVFLLSSVVHAKVNQ